MRTATVSVLLGSLLSSGLALQAAAPVPRPTKEFTIILPSGKQTLLSSYRGKVVMMAFMFTTCPHCQALSKVITKLQGELGPRGFQAVGAVFNDEVNTPNSASNAQVTASFVSEFQVGFPVGYAARESVLSYLGVSDIESWVVAPGGTVVCGDIHMSDIPSFPYADLWEERTIRSVANLTRRDAEEFLALAPRVPVKTQVTAYPLEDANGALADLRAGRFTGAAVLTV